MEQESTGIRVKTSTKLKLEEFASRKRLSLIEAADIAAGALAILTREQIDTLIEGQHTAAPTAA